MKAMSSITKNSKYDSAVPVPSCDWEKSRDKRNSQQDEGFFIQMSSRKTGLFSTLLILVCSNLYGRKSQETRIVRVVQRRNTRLVVELLRGDPPLNVQCMLLGHCLTVNMFELFRSF